MKTHLPVDALVFSPKAKYIYIGRDGRDVIWSLYNHHATANDEWYRALNESPGLVGPPIGPPQESVVEYFKEWLDKDGYPFWSLWENVKSWWEIRNLPNIFMLHYSELKADMPGQIRRVAEFLDIEIDESKWNDILEHCSFDYMKNHAVKSVPLGGALWKEGAESFIHRGTNGRWKDMLSEEDCKCYEEKATEMLGEECAKWLANCKLIRGGYWFSLFICERWSNQPRP